MGGSNVGDLLNAKEVTWGWFQGGFKPTSTTAVSGKIRAKRYERATALPETVRGSATRAW